MWFICDASHLVWTKNSMTCLRNHKKYELLQRNLILERLEIIEMALVVVTLSSSGFLARNVSLGFGLILYPFLADK